jgi:hypothetical protein
MKRLTLILTATALLLTTACTEPEKIRPQALKPNPLSLQQEISMTQAPQQRADISADFGRQTTPPIGSVQKGCDQFGELILPPHTEDGSYIRLADGQFLEVINVDLSKFYRKEGRAIKFGYLQSKQGCPTSNLPTPVNLTCIFFLNKDKPSSEKAPGTSHSQF